MTTIRKTLLNLTWIAAGAAIILTACSKPSDIVTPGANKVSLDGSLAVVIPNNTTIAIPGIGVTSGSITRNDSLYTVTDFRQAYSTGPGQPADGNFYWRFNVNEAGTPANYQIKFTGIATGDITSNDSLRFIDKSFGSVVLSDWAVATDPAATPAGANVIGMNQAIGTGIPGGVTAYANNAGWYNYIWLGHSVSPVSGRVVLLKTAGGIWKFQISSIYLGGGTSGSFPYYNFTYAKVII